MRSWLRRGVVFWCVAGRRLRGIGPALAGNVGTGSAFARPRDGDPGVDVPMLAPARSRCRFVDWGYVPLWGGLIVAVEAGNVGTGSAFARPRDGNQDVDVPMLAPTRSRCRFVDWGYVPLWGGLIVAVEEKQSSLTRCFGDGVEAQEGSGKVRCSECPNGAPHTSPGWNPGYGAQPERSKGTPHNPGCSHLFCGSRVPGLALGIGASTALPGISPALAGKLRGGWGFRAVREGGV